MTLREHLEAILAEPVLYEEADYGAAIHHAKAALAIIGDADAVGRLKNSEEAAALGWFPSNQHAGTHGPAASSEHWTIQRPPLRLLDERDL